MSNPTDVEFVSNTTVISAAWLNGINDWVYPAYTSGTFVFNGATVTFAGTNGTTITFPSSNGTLVTTGGATFTGEVNYKGAGAVATNTAFGSGALDSNTTGQYNTAFGYNALTANTTKSNNTAFGYQALLADVGLYGANTAIGSGTLKSLNAVGLGRNTAIGFGTLNLLTSGYHNTAIGYNSGNGMTTGTGNVSVGYLALSTDCSSYNVAIGAEALTNSTGLGNVAVGANSGDSVTSGGGHTLLGYYAGDTITTGTYNVIIGYNSDVSVNTVSNSIAIGYGTTVDKDNQIILGNTSSTELVLNGMVTTPPATATSTGIKGQIATDGSHLYICTATDTWVRSALATW